MLSTFISRGIIALLNIGSINLLSYVYGKQLIGQLIGFIGVMTIFSTICRFGWEQKMLKIGAKYVPLYNIILSSTFSFVLFNVLNRFFSLNSNINRIDHNFFNIILCFIIFVLINIYYSIECLMRQETINTHRLLLLASSSPTIGFLFCYYFLDKLTFSVLTFIYFLSITLITLVFLMIYKKFISFKFKFLPNGNNDYSILYFPASINSLISQHYIPSLLLITGNVEAIVYFATIQRFFGLSKWPISIFTFSYKNRGPLVITP